MAQWLRIGHMFYQGGKVIDMVINAKKSSRLTRVINSHLGVLYERVTLWEMWKSRMVAPRRWNAGRVTRHSEGRQGDEREAG